MRAYFADRGEGDQRDTIVTADTAHGTNPASVTMAGYKLAKVRTDTRGNVDIAHLRELVDERTAGLMLTNPTTLGLFDEQSRRSRRFSASRRASLRRCEPQRGLRHFASRRHGLRHRAHQPAQDVFAAAWRRRARQRTGVVRDNSSRSCRCPPSRGTATRSGSTTTGRNRSGRCAATRARSASSCARIRTSAWDGPRLKGDVRTAVLNANYLLALLKDAYNLPFDRLCMHEFVLSARSLKREHGISATDVAKRLMDYGFHPPTIYFPLVVPEALMIEPTETEAKETLDAFAEAMLAITEEAAADPDVIREAPHGRPVRRLDEVRAAKRAIVKYGFDEHDNPATDGPVEPRQLEAQKGA